jgi:hypothetical protein
MEHNNKDKEAVGAIGKSVIFGLSAILAGHLAKKLTNKFPNGEITRFVKLAFVFVVFFTVMVFLILFLLVICLSVYEAVVPQPLIIPPSFPPPSYASPASLRNH